MKYKCIILALLMSLALWTGGCSSQKGSLDPAHPTTITLWNYYNGDLLDQFNALVDQFNQTVGKEKGIIVQSSSAGGVEALETNLWDAVNEKAGGAEMPNIFSCYANTAYQISQEIDLINLNDYLTKDQLEEYVAGYLEEGIFGDSERNLIMPVAKSTEVLFLNSTDWETFSEATGTDISLLSTYEGITQAAEAYYEWTDSLTEEEGDGKAFFGHDAIANFMYIACRQMGKDLFTFSEDDSVVLNIDEKIMRRIWDNYYVPSVKGYFVTGIRFCSDALRTGSIISYIGSSAGASYFPREVYVGDEEAYEIELAVLPSPVFENGEKAAVQQGAGMVIADLGEAENEAAIAFLDWFTDEEQNVSFAVSSGYLPVKQAANDLEVINRYTEDEGGLISETLKVGIETISEFEMYTPLVFDQANDVRSILSNELTALTVSDREAVLIAVSEGKTEEEALEHYLSDAYFEAWFASFSEKLQDALGK